MRDIHYITSVIVNIIIKKFHGALQRGKTISTCHSNITQCKVKELGVCWNSCFRKILHYNKWESVEELQYFCNELPSAYIFDLYTCNFLSNSQICQAQSVDLFIRLNSYVIDAFKLKYTPSGSSQLCRKRAIHQYVAEQFA